MAIKSEVVATTGGRRYAGEEIGGAADGGTLSTASEVLQGTSKKGRIARILPFLGPAFIACIAYMDPGNFATNIQGGAQFGYLLVWVIVASNLMAMLIQTLSAKLGIATGKNLPEMIRLQFPRPVVWLQLFGLADRRTIRFESGEPTQHAAEIGFSTSAEITRRSRAKGVILFATPINLIVPAPKARPGEVGNFVVFVAGGG